MSKDIGFNKVKMYLLDSNAQLRIDWTANKAWLFTVVSGKELCGPIPFERVPELLDGIIKEARGDGR